MHFLPAVIVPNVFNLHNFLFYSFFERAVVPPRPDELDELVRRHRRVVDLQGSHHCLKKNIHVDAGKGTIKIL